MKWLGEHNEVIMLFITFSYAIATIALGIVLIINEKEGKELKTEYVEIIRYATEQEQIEHDKQEIEMLAKTVWGEARGCSKEEKAAVIWCVLNRVDDDRFPNNITDVITQENQFSGYNANHPIDPDIVELANDVMTRWVFEKTAVGGVGRVLPKEYCWFRAENGKNVFRNAYKGDYSIWDLGLCSPYKE